MYGAALLAIYWSAALVHLVFLHNKRVHPRTHVTLHEAWYGVKPNLSNLRMFGLRVCVKRSGKQRAKLDCHSLRGIFIGYTETLKNIRYIDLKSRVVKAYGHATYNKA